MKFKPDLEFGQQSLLTVIRCFSEMLNFDYNREGIPSHFPLFHLIDCSPSEVQKLILHLGGFICKDKGKLQRVSFLC